jgi:hypothetical protein
MSGDGKIDYRTADGGSTQAISTFVGRQLVGLGFPTTNAWPDEGARSFWLAANEVADGYSVTDGRHYLSGAP